MGTMQYNREHSVTVLLRFNKKTDKDIIEHLSKVGNKVGYFKRLVRNDIARKKPDIDAYIDAAEMQE